MYKKFTLMIVSIVSLFPAYIYGREMNVALDASAQASSCIDAGHNEMKAIDNNMNSYWEASGTFGPHYLILDLKDFYFLNKIQQTFTRSSVWQFKIEGSVDKENWMLLVDKTKGAAGITFAESVKGIFRYVKLTVAGSSDNFPASSKELKIIGTKNGNNLALGKRFVDSTGQWFCEPERAVDDDMSSYWCALDGSYPKSIILDLDKTCIITGVQQVFKDYDHWKYTIEGSNDLQAWDMLENKSKGENLVEFYSPAEGNYRYIKLTVLGSSSRFWSNSCELRVFGFEKEEDRELETFADSYNTSLPGPKKEWWKETSGLIRYYCKLYKNQLSSITDSLDILKSQGFNIIELMCPYKGSAKIWAGLGATDNYDIDPSVGTMEDFEKLIKEAHARDMKVLFFGNVGYCSDEAPFFQKACDDERNDVYSKERNWFHFSKKKLDASWFWSERAQAYYYSFWGNTDGADGRIPSYNFNNQEWRDECENYLRFWAEKGIDGLYLDAPEVYDGITDDIIQKYIVDVLNSYEGLSTNAEGSGDYNRWIGRYGFNCIQGFDLYGWGGGGRSEVLNAMRNKTPGALNDMSKGYRDRVTSLYGVTLTPPMWEMKATIDERIFETAYLTTVGTLFANHCGDKMFVAQDIMKKWPQEDRERFHNLIRTQNSYAGLAPSGQRTILPTSSSKSYLAFKRSNPDGNVSALVIFNFRDQERKMTVDLTNSGISVNQIPVDLLTGREAEPITSEKYTVTLPPYGYKILGVENGSVKSNPTGIKAEKNNSFPVISYPNPFRDGLVIESVSDLQRISVISSTGQTLKEYYNMPAKTYLSLQDLLPAVYFLKTQDKGGNINVKKIIKTN